MGQRPFALMHQRVGEIVEGALTAVAPVAFAPWAVVVIAPGIDVVALTPRTLERTISPAQTMDIGVAGLDIEELVQMREDRHGCVQRSLVALISPLELVSGPDATSKTRPTTRWLAPPAVPTSD